MDIFLRGGRGDLFKLLSVPAVLLLFCSGILLLLSSNIDFIVLANLCHLVESKSAVEECL